MRRISGGLISMAQKTDRRCESTRSQARFVMASTGLVYDADASHPGLEDEATNPKLAYPASKIAAENRFRSSRRQPRWENSSTHCWRKIGCPRLRNGLASGGSSLLNPVET